MTSLLPTHILARLIVLLCHFDGFDKAINEPTSCVGYGSAGQTGIPRVVQLFDELAVELFCVLARARLFQCVPPDHRVAHMGYKQAARNGDDKSMRFNRAREAK
jgi:hypothetical protein